MIGNMDLFHRLTTQTTARREQLYKLWCEHYATELHDLWLAPSLDGEELEDYEEFTREVFAMSKIDESALRQLERNKWITVLRAQTTPTTSHSTSQTPITIDSADS